eukprot:g24372.t1
MPRENSIHKGLVVCTKEYGAFVQLGKGEKFKDGFLHIGCLPNPPGVERVEVVNSVVREGDTVWVKVRDVDVFPKQQLKHIHAANAVISSQREGFELKSEIEKRKEEETRDVW